MKLAIVILNWNGKKLLNEFLPTVIEFSKGHDIYVVDNASKDDSVKFLQQNFPNVNAIELSKNYGYAGGYNRAVQQIDAELLCFLNSDVRVSKNWLKPIIKSFKKDRSMAIAQPKILDQKNPDLFEYAGAAGGFIDQLGYPYCRGRIFDTIEADHGQYNDECSIFWASGACFFIRKNIFVDLDGFDETFFAHMEEIDLCWRAHNLKQNVKYIGCSTVYHLGGASLSKNNPKKTFYNFRNSLFALTKNSHRPLFPTILLRLILDGFAGIYFLLSGKITHTLAIIKAHVSFYSSIPDLLKFRNKQQRSSYDSHSSIVWRYFIKKRKKFQSHTNR